MIAVLRPENETPVLIASKKMADECRLFISKFPQDSQQIDFYYYINENDADRYFIIRVQPATAGDFVPAIEAFAATQKFSILNDRQSRIVLHKIDILRFR